MADKAQINSKISNCYKVVVVVPILFMLYNYIRTPELRFIPVLLQLIIYWIVCFMTPLYILRYVLKYHNMEAKYLNIIASLAVVFSYILLGVKLFLQRSFILSPVNFYIIPFEIFIFGGGFTFLLLTLYFIYYKFKGKDKKAKSD